MERCKQFLSDELHSCAREHVHDRVYFTSGKEMLNWKVRGNKFIPQPSGQFLERKREFEQFEKMLNHHLTSTSLHTKYGNHCITGKKICRQLLETIDFLLDIIEEEESNLSMEEERISKLIDNSYQEMEGMAMNLKDDLKVIMLD